MKAEPEVPHRSRNAWGGLRRAWENPLWRQPIPLWAFLLVGLGIIAGFAIGLSENATTAHNAAQANARVIAEIAARQHQGCIASNDSRKVLRNVINIAIPDQPAAVAPPFPAHPDVQAYIQQILNGSSRDRSTLRAQELAGIPPDTNCRTISRR